MVVSRGEEKVRVVPRSTMNTHQKPKNLLRLVVFEGGSMLVIASTPFEFGFLPCSVMACPRTWSSLAKKVHFVGLNCMPTLTARANSSS